MACFVQFGLLVYSPAAAVPSRADREAGEALLKRIAAFDGEVWVQSHGYLAERAGKHGTAHAMAVFDVLRAAPASEDGLLAEIRDVLRRRWFEAILCDSHTFRLREEISTHYEPAGRLFEDRTVFLPPSGLRIRPEVVYLPRVVRTPSGTVDGSASTTP
jgi:hypothetical protein